MIANYENQQIFSVISINTFEALWHAHSSEHKSQKDIVNMLIL